MSHWGRNLDPSPPPARLICITHMHQITAVWYKVYAKVNSQTQLLLTCASLCSCQSWSVAIPPIKAFWDHLPDSLHYSDLLKFVGKHTHLHS